MGKLALFILILNAGFAYAQEEHITPEAAAHVREVIEQLEVLPNIHQESGPLPTVEIVNSADGDRDITVGLSNGFKFHLAMKDYEAGALTNYNSLPESRQKFFLSARKSLMKGFAALLTGTFFVPGTYYVVRDTVYFAGQKFEPIRQGYRRHSPTTPMTIFRESSWNPEARDWTISEKSYREQMYERFTRILILLDEQLIRMAGALNIYNKEFTDIWLDIALVPGFGARGGRIGGGKSPPLYLSLGFDWKNKRLLTRVWGDNEIGIIGQSLSLPSMRIGLSLSGAESKERTQKLIDGQNYQPWGPFIFSSTPDRTTVAVAYDLLAVGGAFTASWYFGLEPLGVLLTTLSSGFFPGYSWFMSSVGTVTRAEFWEAVIKLKEGQAYSRLLPGHEVVSGILGKLVSMLKDKSQASIGRLRAGYVMMRTDPRATVERWRERPTVARAPAKSCVLSLNLKTAIPKND